MPIKDKSTLASIIETGGGLLGGLLQGIGKGKAAKEFKKETRPTTPYYESFTSLPILQSLLQRSLLGAMGTQLGGNTLEQWGLDPEQILKTLSAARRRSVIPPGYSILTNKY